MVGQGNGMARQEPRPTRRRSLFSLSPIGGEGRGEGARRFMAPMRVQSWRSWLSMDRLLFSLSHRMGEGWGEGTARFMASVSLSFDIMFRNHHTYPNNLHRNEAGAREAHRAGATPKRTQVPALWAGCSNRWASEACGRSAARRWARAIREALIRLASLRPDDSRTPRG